MCAKKLWLQSDLTQQVHAGRCDFVFREMVLFVGQKFLTHPPTDEVLNYCLSALRWGFFYGFLNLWRAVNKAI